MQGCGMEGVQIQGGDQKEGARVTSSQERRSFDLIIWKVQNAFVDEASL